MVYFIYKEDDNMNNGFQRPSGFQDTSSFQRPNGFQRPTSFSSDKETKSVLINNMKNKALNQINEIDRHPYTLESMTKRKELSKIVRDCDSMLTMTTVNQNTDNKLESVDLGSMQNSDELLEYLVSKNSPQNNKDRDLQSIQKYINGKRNNTFNNFMYEESVARNGVNPMDVQYSVDPSKSSDAFIISGVGEKPLNESAINYRITLRNGAGLNNNDVKAFMQTFQREAQKRNIYVRCKVLFEQSDGIVFYVDKNNLLEIVKLLEDLKNANVYGQEVTNAINNFGAVQPFSATMDKDSYYGIAMHGAESSSRLISTRGGGLASTFNQYMDSSLNNAYNSLLAKYGNDASKITAEELYNYIMINHRDRMHVEGDIPLWMNNRIYNDLGSKKMSL
jgi:hypothetical protein